MMTMMRFHCLPLLLSALCCCMEVYHIAHEHKFESCDAPENQPIFQFVSSRSGIAAGLYLLGVKHSQIMCDVFNMCRRRIELPYHFEKSRCFSLSPRSIHPSAFLRLNAFPARSASHVLRHLSIQHIFISCQLHRQPAADASCQVLHLISLPMRLP